MKPAAQRKAEQRARARLLGLCSSCCKRRALAGFAYCKHCRLTSKVRASRYYHKRRSSATKTPTLQSA